MKKTFLQQLYALQEIVFLFGTAVTDKKVALLKSLSKLPWKNAVQLNQLQDLLLFMAAHPENETIRQLTEQALHKIAQFFKRTNDLEKEYADNGYPHTRMITRFSHDLLSWMNQWPECALEIDSFDGAGTDLNTLLRMTLPALERDETTAGLSNDDLLHALQIKKKDKLSFLLREFSKLDDNPFIKDHLWDELKVWIGIHAKDQKFSRAFNRVPVPEIFMQQELLKKFDHNELIQKTLPSPQKMTLQQQTDIAAVIKKSLILTMRETDPSTYMDESTLRWYPLERGISVAIYGMKPDRQLPLQSYVGYTLFKNGFPVAYGGSWIFGRYAMFGLNIFEAFRGGESGYIMCQLLRVYRQAFSIDYVEVEPYQYGKDNPDGIKSGAFWFYYRYGFRPVDKQLRSLAENEQLKIRSKQGYRTNPEILLQFTDSNIALHLNGKIPVKLTAITTKVSRMIATEFNGDRVLAIEYCIAAFLTKIGNKNRYSNKEKAVLTDMALVAQALRIDNKETLHLMKHLIKTKPLDPYRYNQLIRQLFSEYPHL